MKLAIVVGHSQERQGAVAVDKVQEWTWQRVLAHQVMAEVSGSRVFYRPAGPYTRAMKKLVAEVNGWEPDLVVSLHFNAFAEPPGIDPVHGTMALHWPGSRAGRRWAGILSAAVADAQRTRDKGPREQAKSWGGATLWILQATKAPAVILETHYGDTASDHRKATEARDCGRTARAIAKAIELNAP